MTDEQYERHPPFTAADIRIAVLEGELDVARAEIEMLQAAMQVNAVILSKDADEIQRLRALLIRHGVTP